MPKSKKQIELEIACVLFVDIVGYSKLVTIEQQRLLELLGLIEAVSAERRRLGEGPHALELLPLAKNWLKTTDLIGYFAIIAVRVDEKDLPCEELGKAGHLAGFGTITYRRLTVTSDWGPLRGDPRFDKIIISPAAKEAGK